MGEGGRRVEGAPPPPPPPPPLSTKKEKEKKKKKKKKKKKEKEKKKKKFLMASPAVDRKPSVEEEAIELLKEFEKMKEKEKEEKKKIGVGTKLSRALAPNGMTKADKKEAKLHIAEKKKEEEEEKDACMHFERIGRRR